MEIDTLLSNQPLERQSTLTKIHDTILGNDKNVKAEAGNFSERLHQFRLCFFGVFRSSQR